MAGNLFMPVQPHDEYEVSTQIQQLFLLDNDFRGIIQKLLSLKNYQLIPFKLSHCSQFDKLYEKTPAISSAIVKTALKDFEKRAKTEIPNEFGLERTSPWLLTQFKFQVMKAIQHHALPLNTFLQLTLLTNTTDKPTHDHPAQESS